MMFEIDKEPVSYSQKKLLHPQRCTKRVTSRYYIFHALSIMWNTYCKINEKMHFLDGILKFKCVTLYQLLLRMQRCVTVPTNSCDITNNQA